MKWEKRPARLAWLGVQLALLAVSCGPPGDPPAFSHIGQQVAFVGTEYRLVLKATDPDGDPLEFGFSSNIPDLCRGSRCRAGLRDGDPGRAMFVWTPRASDVGIWAIDFTVTDGGYTTKETVPIEVRSSVGYNGSPIFVQPLGTGTTMDVTGGDCLEFDVVLSDPDSTEVAIALEPPVLEGAELETVDEFSAHFQWCPTREQAEGDDYYRVVLSADDGRSPRTLKDYLLVLRRPPKPDCDGEGPVIRHTPANWSSAGNVMIHADISDDIGLKRSPLLYYSSTPPTDPPDLGSMIQLSMHLVAGGMQNGSWEASIANPTATLPSGSTVAMYYVISAVDNDDPDGDCDHLTESPESGAHHISVTNSPEAPRLGPCDACTTDTQCGGDSDNCVHIGGTASYCLVACGGDGSCPANYECSESDLESVDHHMGRLCVPTAATCGPTPMDPPTGGTGGTSCMDDMLEENDDRATANTRPELSSGTHDGLISCFDASGNNDEDWYKVRVGAESQVMSALSGGGDSDIDLALYDSSGTRRAVSDSLSSMEEVTACLEPGTYFLRAYAFGRDTNTYRLAWSTRATSCGATCATDSREPDSDSSHARNVTLLSEYRSADNTICDGNDDWYRVYLRTGQTVAVELTFIQSTSSEDLDLHFLDGSLRDLTPCTEADPSTCSAFQGQSIDSDEYYDHTVSATGYYYILVHGFAGSENSYDIRIWLAP